MIQLRDKELPSGELAEIAKLISECAEGKM